MHHKIRELKRCDNIPVILYSNELTDTLIKRAYDTGAQYCLKKTSDLASLHHHLEMIFSKIQLRIN